MIATWRPFHKYTHSDIHLDAFPSDDLLEQMQNQKWHYTLNIQPYWDEDLQDMQTSDAY